MRATRLHAVPHGDAHLYDVPQQAALPSSATNPQKDIGATRHASDCTGRQPLIEAHALRNSLDHTGFHAKLKRSVVLTACDGCSTGLPSTVFNQESHSHGQATMSVATDVTVLCQLSGGPPPGEYLSFGADLMFSSLVLGKDSILREFPYPVIHEDWNFFLKHTQESLAEPGGVWSWSGALVVQDNEYTQWAFLCRDGRVLACRPGTEEAWKPLHACPTDAASVPLVVNLTNFEGDWHARGLPISTPADADGVQSAWHVSIGGKLHEHAPANSFTDAMLFDGWVWMGRHAAVPTHALRFASGRMQWIVPITNGVAQAPMTLGDILPRKTQDDGRQTALLRACAVMPTDYTDYGGDAVRWDTDDKMDSDCSSGCRWWCALSSHKANGQVERDHDWGVCANPCSPRRGLLTWEHQAGRGCFEQGAEIEG